jgi:DNA repair exonuclease SbcCD ATPase subunit
MIVFEKIKWKNFLSTGNHFIEIELNKATNTLIIGSNGAGKSTILDALTFVLFGKSFRKINKPQLINVTNEKDCVVEIEFSIGTVNWKIIRGLKPNIFEIYRNGDVLNQQSSSVDQQKFLEQTVLKMNYKSFTQIVILGSSNFIPFMQLSAAGRREVIEDLLDIKIFSTMNALIKDKIRQFKENIRILELKKESLNEKVGMQKSFIEELENRGKENIHNKKNEINSLEEKNNNFLIQNNKIENEINLLNDKLLENSKASEKLRKLGNIKGKISQKIRTISDEQLFFNEQKKCPTCTQDIDENLRQSKIKESEEKLKELGDGYQELQNAINEEERREKIFINLSENILKLNQEFSKNNTKFGEYKKRINEIQKEIHILIEKLKNKNEEHKKLDQYQNDLESIYEEIVEEKLKSEHYDFCQNLLKDKGVKTKIIEKYLPLINQQVNKYLQMMDFFINFTFDDEFNETVLSPIHEDFSYSSFSEGEKQRIDLSLLFTWREVAKIKNSTNTNLLILDEIFDSSLDGFGTDDFLKIIRYVIKDSNTFIISHKESLHDKFNNTIKFEKKKNFSHMVEIKCQN